MPAQIAPSTLQFLKDLAANNNRDWFNDNKKTYQEAKENFEAFVDALIAQVAQFDPSIAHHTAKKVSFRIYRDVRFAKDKSPYKTHFGANLSSAEKRSEIHTRAGYYIHVAPHETMIAGGAYLPESAWLKNIRGSLASRPEEYLEIINNPTFVKNFGEIEGEQLKTAPKGYPKDHPQIELLRYKSFLAKSTFSSKEVLNASFLKQATARCQALHPLDEYLNSLV